MPGLPTSQRTVGRFLNFARRRAARRYYGAAPFGADADAPAPTPPATLYDVFERIRDDERAHWSNLVSLVQFESLEAAGPATPTRACAPEDDACLAATDECAVAYAR